MFEVLYYRILNESNIQNVCGTSLKLVLLFEMWFYGCFYEGTSVLLVKLGITKYYENVHKIVTAEMQYI